MSVMYLLLLFSLSLLLHKEGQIRISNQEERLAKNINMGFSWEKHEYNEMKEKCYLRKTKRIEKIE